MQEGFRAEEEGADPEAPREPEDFDCLQSFHNNFGGDTGEAEQGNGPNKGTDKRAPGSVQP